jgi:hypothetical protein
MTYTVEMALGSMIYISSFMMIGSGIQIIVRLLPQQFDRLQFWYYSWEGFMKHTTELASGGTIYLPSFIKIGSGVQKLLWGGIHIHTDSK